MGRVNLTPARYYYPRFRCEALARIAFSRRAKYVFRTWVCAVVVRTALFCNTFAQTSGLSSLKVCAKLSNHSFTVERFGRRTILLYGACASTVLLSIFPALVAVGGSAEHWTAMVCVSTMLIFAVS